MAKNLSLILASLHSKVEKLIYINKRSAEELRKVKDENEVMREELKQLKKKIDELEEKNKVLALAKSLSGDEQGKNELKLKINELVREIDKCIALTNG
ncbi:MAG: hypothetical protein ACKOXB_12865 [Flavobacteriales bacterium]